MRSVLLAAVAGLVLAAPASTQGWIDPVRPIPVGDWGVVKLRTSVNVRVTGRIARVEVEEWFQNNGPPLGEGDYLYPLPGEAVFSNFSLFQGDQELRGETMDATRAREIYEAIVRAKKDPALIELAGHGLVRARVFPIARGETRKITLRYTQVLNRAGDALQFRYAAGARNGQSNTPRMLIDRPGITREQPARLPDPAPLSFTLTADNGREFRDAFSPTHEVRSVREDGRLVVRPMRDLSGDFALFLPLSNTAVGITIASHRPSGEDGYFMLTLSPGESRESAVPRDITAVIDVSGSMSGEKMNQARAALRQLLGSLTARDRFRLISFSNDVRSYQPEWTAATTAELERARAWVADLRAEGGTNISGALDEAFRATTPEERLGIVLFITDGLPSVGEQNPERIAQKAERERGRARVFAFGVGYDVNTYLLDRLSAAARGTTQYVQPSESVEHAIATLAAKIRHPVLADLRLNTGAMRIIDVYPRELPDLFAGEELVLFGRYQTDRALEGDIVLTGRRGGSDMRYSTRASFAAHENGNDFIPRLWASRKISALTQQLRLEGQDPRVVEEIRELALRHGLLSEYTSYLVQEPNMAVAGMQMRGAGGGGGRGGRQASGAATGAVMPQAQAVMASPPPSAQQGQSSVQAAQRVQQSRDVRSEEMLAKSQSQLKDAARSRDDASSRVIAGRHFRLENAVWTDAAHVKTQRVLNLEPFSPAYFAVLKQLPELEAYWKELDAVLVAGKRVSVQVSKGGVSTLASAELNRLVAEFRSN
jgi:Ca-activated chloride channel homolog